RQPRQPAGRPQVLMGRRPLPSLTGSTPLVRGREFARTAADSVADILHPLITIARGLCALAASGCRHWVRMPRDRRGPTVMLAGSSIAIVALVPYGPTLATIAVMVMAAWAGRDRSPGFKIRTDQRDGRLHAL